MNDFFNSKFIEDLKEGELPEVKITVQPDTIFHLALAAFFVAIAVSLIGKILKQV